VTATAENFGVGLVVTVTFLPSAWSAKGFNCRPSGLVKLNLGELVAA